MTQNGLKFIFYPDRHGWTRIDPVDSVLTKNDGFDRNGLKTHFLPWLTWFDPYWSGGLGFDWKWRFWPKQLENSFFTLVDMVWPVLTRWARFWPKWRFLPETTWKLIFYPSRHGLTRIDPVELVFMERYGWPEKNIFLNFKLFLNFFWIFMNNNRNKTTFKKILVNPKLGYNNWYSIYHLTCQNWYEHKYS